MTGDTHTGPTHSGSPTPSAPATEPGPSAGLTHWHLERLHAGEPNAATVALRKADLSPADRARLEALAADDVETLATLPPAWLAEQVRRRAAAQSHAPRWRTATWALAGLTAAAAALVIWRVGAAPDARTSPRGLGEVADTVRAKGGADPVSAGAQLLVYRQRGPAEPELLSDNTAARPGDAIQLGWVVPEPCYGALVSMDGAGAITVHHADGQRASALAAGRHVLDHAFVLDAAPAYERFVLITGAQPFEVAEVLAAAKAGADPQAPLPVPAGLSQTSLRLLKVAPR